MLSIINFLSSEFKMLFLLFKYLILVVFFLCVTFYIWHYELRTTTAFLTVLKKIVLFLIWYLAYNLFGDNFFYVKVYVIKVFKCNLGII